MQYTHIPFDSFRPKAKLDGATSVQNATRPQHLFSSCHLFIYLLIVSSQPVWQRQSWVCPLERNKKCSAHSLDGPQLLTGSQKPVQMVSFFASSFSSPSLRFKRLLVLCFQKRTTTCTTWFQLWKWKAIASVWCFSTLVYRHIKHKEGKRRREGAVKGFATTTSIHTIILVACGCCECFSAEFPPIKEPDWLKHTFLCASVFFFIKERNLHQKSDRNVFFL